MKEYDAVIIANSPGGWVAAIILSQKGRKVLLIDRVKPRYGELVPRGGIFFQMWPELARELPGARTLFQVIAPGHRFGIPPGYHRFLSELEHEFPHVQPSFRENIERVRNTGQIFSDYLTNRFLDPGKKGFNIGKGKIFEAISLWSRFQKIKTLSVDELDAEFSESPLLRAVFEIPNWFASNLVWEAEKSGMGSFAAYQRYAFFPLSPLSKPVPGIVEMDVIFAALRAKANEMDLEIIHQELKNDVESNMRVSPEKPGKFFFSPGRNVRRGIGDHRMELQKDEVQVQFRSLLWTGEILSFVRNVQEHFQKDRGFKRLFRMAESLVVDHFLDTTVIKVRPDAVPEGMEQKVFLIRETSRLLSHENILFIRVGSSYAPLFGKDILQIQDEKEQCVRIYVSYLRPVSGQAEPAAENVWEKLNWLMPFLHEFMIDGPELCPGSLSGNDGTVIWKKSHENTEISGFAMPLGRSGVFYSGRELLPAIGGEADLLSGLVAAWKMENWLEGAG